MTLVITDAGIYAEGPIPSAMTVVSVTHGRGDAADGPDADQAGDRRGLGARPTELEHVAKGSARGSFKVGQILGDGSFLVEPYGSCWQHRRCRERVEDTGPRCTCRFKSPLG